MLELVGLKHVKRRFIEGSNSNFVYVFRKFKSDLNTPSSI